MYTSSCVLVARSQQKQAQRFTKLLEYASCSLSQLLLLLLLLKTSRLSWRKPKLRGHGKAVTKRLERVDVIL